MLARALTLKEVVELSNSPRERAAPPPAPAAAAAVQTERGPSALLRVIELRRLDVHKVHEVDTAKNCFDMTFFVTFAFPGGAADSDLASKSYDLYAGPREKKLASGS